MDIYYTIEELTDSIINKYDLELINDEQRRMYYQRIYRALKENDMLDKGVIMVNQKTKRKSRHYSETQKKILLEDEKLSDYLITRSNSIAIKNKIKNKNIRKEMEDLRNAAIEFFSAQKYDSADDKNPSLSEEYIRQRMSYMMLKAIFELYFTPIDEKMLKQDLWNIEIFLDETHPDPKLVKSRIRLEKPEGNYYKKRTRERKSKA